jgi:hypothetical protein
MAGVGGVAAALSGAGGSITPPTMSSAAPTAGASPNAKRVALMPSLGPTDGPTLDMPTASKLIYELQQQMQALDPWATSVQVAITDHAKLIDSARDKTQGLNIQSNISFEKLRTEMLAVSGRFDLSESDLRRVHDEGAQRDTKLRSELNAMSDKLSVGHDSLAAAVAQVACSLAEVQRDSTGAARPEPAPGLGGTFDQLASQVNAHHLELTALHAKLETEKVRTDLAAAAAQEAGRMAQQLALSVAESRPKRDATRQRQPRELTQTLGTRDGPAQRQRQEQQRALAAQAQPAFLGSRRPSGSTRLRPKAGQASSTHADLGLGSSTTRSTSSTERGCTTRSSPSSGSRPCATTLPAAARRWTRCSTGSRSRRRRSTPRAASCTSRCLTASRRETRELERSPGSFGPSLVH